MKIFRVSNTANEAGRTELFLTKAVADLYAETPRAKAVAACLKLIEGKYGETVKTLVAASVPGIMDFMIMPSIIDAQHALVIDLYIDWMDEAEKIAGKVRPIYKPHVLVSYYLCTPGELKALHQRVLNGEPENIDLTETRESA